MTIVGVGGRCWRETGDKGRKGLRTSSIICPQSETRNLCHSENWIAVPLPQMLLEYCSLVIERKWASRGLSWCMGFWEAKVIIVGGVGVRRTLGNSPVAVHAGTFAYFICSENPRTI